MHGYRGLSVLLLLDLLMLAPSAHAITAFYYTGSEQTILTKGQTAIITPADGYPFVTTVGNRYGQVYMIIRPTGPEDSWLDLTLPKGQTLAPGTYQNARSPSYSQDPTLPGIELWINGSGRQVGQKGVFTILEVSADYEKLLSFAADFTVYEGGALASWNYGSIRYNSTVPLNILPPKPLRPLAVACYDFATPPVAAYMVETTCEASGGVGPYTWTTENLPTNITQMYPESKLDSTHFQSRYAPGFFNYTIIVTDSNGDTASYHHIGTDPDLSCKSGVTYSEVANPFYFGPSGGTARWGYAPSSSCCPWRIASYIQGIDIYNASGYTPTEGDSLTLFANYHAGSVPLVGEIPIIESGRTVQKSNIVVNSNSCSYSVDPVSVHFGPEGGSGILKVTPNQKDCHPFQIGSSSPA